MRESTTAVAVDPSESTQLSTNRQPAIIPLNEPGPQVWVMMAALFVVSLLIRLICFTGLIGSDDLAYFKFGEGIASGTYQLEAIHNALRYGLLIPLAASYRIFGVHEWTTVLPSLVISSLAPPLLGLITARLSGIRQAWIAGLLMATFPVAVRYGSIMVPEPILETLLLVAAWLFLLAQAQDSSVFALATGVVLAVAYLTKEPAAFVAMAFFLFLVVTRRWKLAFVMGCGVALILAVEFAWYWKESGDLLYRLHAMAWNNESEMAVDANKDLLYRLLKQYPRMMLVPSVDYGLHSLLALGVGAAVLFWRRSATTLWLLLWAVLPFLYLDFGTSSFRYFWALPAAPRYLGLVYQPLFVLTGIALVSWASSDMVKRVAAVSAVAAVCAVGLACGFVTRDTGYHTAEVRQLKKIAVEARQDGTQICPSDGSGPKEWQQTLQIIAPDQLGCAGPSLVSLTPDARGLPMIARQ